jgi:hypothetical protein
MPNPPLSEEERKRRKQALNRKRSHADVYKRKLEKEKSLMDKLTEDQRVEQRRLTALRRSAVNARAYRKRTIADLRSKLKVATVSGVLGIFIIDPAAFTFFVATFSLLLRSSHKPSNVSISIYLEPPYFINQHLISLHVCESL